MGSTVTGPASSAGGCGEAPSKRAPAHTHTMPCTSTAGSSMSAHHRMQSDAIGCNRMLLDAIRRYQMISNAIRSNHLHLDRRNCLHRRARGGEGRATTAQREATACTLRFICSIRLTCLIRLVQLRDAHARSGGTLESPAVVRALDAPAVVGDATFGEWGEAMGAAVDRAAPRAA